MSWIGLDIGGANLKMAEPGGHCRQEAFPLWRQKDQLASHLADMLTDSAADSPIAVTMTGELADCFSDKTEGVAQIVHAVILAAGAGRRCKFYTTNGEWLNADHATEVPYQVAASNWHALACYASRFLTNGNGFLIDIGSTSTDIIPIRNGRPVNEAQTDFDRMRRSQLVYTGVERSSLSGLIDSIAVDGRSVQIANERFATIDDAYVWLGKVAEDAENLNTADGRPATRLHAGQRLARLLCSDFSELGEPLITQISTTAAQQNMDRVAQAITRVVVDNGELDRTFVLSGQGDWLARNAIAAAFPNFRFEIVSLREKIGDEPTRAAAAFAVATLATESPVQPLEETSFASD